MRVMQWTAGLFLMTDAAVASGQGGASTEAKQATSDRSNAEAELRATDLAWSAAASRKDVDATVAYMADDGEYLEVWKKIDGKWKCLSDAYRSDVPLP